MKIIKLKKADMTEWRENVAHLVDDEGYLKSQVDKPLETAISQVTRSARAQRKSLTQQVAIGPSRAHVVAVTVTRTGMNADDLSVVPTVDGMRVVTGREVVAARYLQEHGECQLRAPNNVILKIVRDPGLRRPTFQESQQIAPRPEHCPCRAWGREHPGRHYPTCEWNRLAPPDERAVSDSVPEEDIRTMPTEAFASLRPRAVKTAANTAIAAKVNPNAVVQQAPSLDSPENCRNQCLAWATPKGFPIPKGQHHPTCQYAKPWAIATAKAIPRWLIDMRTGEKVRTASDAEIGEADVTAQRTGSPIIHIDETPYAVVLETQLAEIEAELAPAPVAAPEASPAAPAGAP